jgi:hypothetical protein
LYSTTQLLMPTSRVQLHDSVPSGTTYFSMQVKYHTIKGMRSTHLSFKRCLKCSPFIHIHTNTHTHTYCRVLLTLPLNHVSWIM